MANSVLLSGAEVKIYLGGKPYNEVQSLNYTMDYGEDEIMGIDSIFPQEIATTKVTCSGTISGIKLKASGGSQAKRATPLIGEVLEMNYISIRIEDRNTGYTLFFIPNAKITREDTQIASKGVVKFNLSFKGIMGFQELDVAGSLS